VQEFIEQSLKVNGEGGIANQAPHGSFWTTLSYAEFVNGNVPNVSDPSSGQPLRILEIGNPDNSNLIMALRGTGSLFDVNNGAFGRMPYGGTPFTDDQIGEIADWIAAGCPESELNQRMADSRGRYTPQMGMEFWYQLDAATLYNPPFMAIVGRSGAGAIQNIFAQARSAGRYPGDLFAFVQARRADWILLANVQTDTFSQYLGNDWNNIQSAFEDFGQGVLLDNRPERAARNDLVHLMDIRNAAEPPVGYHRWHASIRTIQLLEIGDIAWWERLDSMLGLGWAIQSYARPKQGTVANPALASQDLEALRRAWIPLTPEQRDRQYDLTGPVGYHPNPMHPTVA